jgi:DNA-binding XRE family transcriptional regulator
MGASSAALGSGDTGCSPLPSTNRQTPESTVRQTLRCPHCSLVQFVTSDRSCRRCHHPVDPEIESHESAPVPAPLPFSHPVNVQVLFNFELSIPVVIYWLRTRQGITQQQLADRMSTVRQTVCKWEAGKRVPEVEGIVMLANGLGVSAAMLMRYCEYLQNGQ